MKLLVLGGTRFVGRHLAQQALALGWQVTLLHRGQSLDRAATAAALPGATQWLADRDQDLSCLAGQAFDVCVDTSAYFPRQVRALGQALAGRVGQYQLVSSISAYADHPPAGAAETAPLARLPDPETPVLDGSTYGGLKAACEAAAQQAFGPQRTLCVRPGLIVGPHDPTGRFTWWVQRLQRGGRVLAPGDPDGSVQWIDARDLAAWQLRQAEAGTTGAFNLTGPAEACSWSAFLQTGLDTLAPPGSTLVWRDEATLLAHGVAPWSELPLWLPAAQQGLLRSPNARALATGLQCRPLAQTLRDTAAWAGLAPAGSPAAGPAQGPPRPPVGMAPEREAALLGPGADRADP